MFTRYAIYYTPDQAFASAGAAWLGWDMGEARDVVQPVIDGLDMAALTQRPHRYGFHGTIKAPFALAVGADMDGLRGAVRDLSHALAAVHSDGLQLAALGRFLALVPVGDQTPLVDMAAQVVRTLDPFRAPTSDAELARRRKGNLSPALEANLTFWGYPHVMDQFRFHMTLTGTIPRERIEDVKAAVAHHFAPLLPAPFVINGLTLAGERADGRFVSIERFALA